MAKKQVAWNVKTKEVIVANDGTALKPDFVKAGTFEHGAAGDPVGVWDKGHVLYHHVQEILYHKGHYNMQIVSITSE